jgi:N-acyl-D-amino-acid deacylase
VIALEEAIRKMTSLPGQHFRLEGRGLIKEGYAADVTIFDAATVGDTATFQKPHAFAAGVPYVLVNGVPVVRNGQHTGARAGQVLAAPAGAR